MNPKSLNLVCGRFMMFINNCATEFFVFYTFILSALMASFGFGNIFFAFVLCIFFSSSLSVWLHYLTVILGARDCYEVI